MAYASPMPRVEPAPINPDGNPVSNSLLARVIGQPPDILTAFGRLDSTLRFKGILPLELKEAVRRATAGGVGYEYCQSLGAPEALRDTRTSLAVGFAELVAADPSGITDAQFDVLREGSPRRKSSNWSRRSRSSRSLARCSAPCSGSRPPRPRRPTSISRR